MRLKIETESSLNGELKAPDDRNSESATVIITMPKDLGRVKQHACRYCWQKQ